MCTFSYPLPIPYMFSGTQLSSPSRRRRPPRPRRSSGMRGEITQCDPNHARPDLNHVGEAWFEWASHDLNPVCDPNHGDSWFNSRGWRRRGLIWMSNPCDLNHIMIHITETRDLNHACVGGRGVIWINNPYWFKSQYDPNHGDSWFKSRVCVGAGCDLNQQSVMIEITVWSKSRILVI